MEPAEDTSLEAAIRWLVETILGVLLMDKLDVWVRGVKLDDDVAKLKFEVERAESLIDEVRGRADGNKSLARSLARLKELLYDTDDLVDELDYYRLQQQVEGVRRDEPQEIHVAERVEGVRRDEPEGIHVADGVTETSIGDADTPKNSSVGKRESLVWNHFTVTEKVHEKRAKATCNYCGKEYNCESVKNGTTGMRSHMKKKHTQIWNGGAGIKEPTVHPPNPSSTGDTPGSATAIEVATSSSSRKRKRTDKEPAQTTAAITQTPWDKAELSNRIKTITSQLQGILEALSKLLERHGSVCASKLNHHQSTTLDQNLRTSSLLPGKVYGRDAEKDIIIKLITENQSDVVTVLPIVGIAGLGKTALAQLVYNDSEVESKFHHRIWVWVSRNFDEVRLTREMLDFVSQERYEGISSFAKLQEILKSHANSKRLLIVFDDVWDDMKDCRWDKLLAPFVSGQSNGTMILVTTRNLSVAKRLGTLKPVKLNALANDDFWLLFKSRAFGDENYECPRNLSIIGRKISEKLMDNPLAAVSIGALLREDLTVDHWSNILEKEDWKSLGLSEGIMPALKFSYDLLPYHLQQCFSYCSIFPNKHKFFGKELVYIWISQGFVSSTFLRKSLEETGWEYLSDLLNLGFFQQVKQEEELSPDSEIWYSECGLVHHFARMVSRTECATIDGLQCNKMLPSIHHLSIVTDSAYNSKDRYGKIPRNEKFEENLRNAVTSVSKLRTLVLIGQYDFFFLQLFKDILRKQENLRLLHTSATCADFKSPICSSVYPTHLRYVKSKSDWFDGALPVLVKLFHLQVLDVSSYTDPFVPYGMHKLVSLRHLVAEKGVHSEIACTGSMTSLQELHEFKVQPCSSGNEITELQSMNELVELRVSQLRNVESQEEAYGAGLRDKVHLAKLHLSWESDDTAWSEEEYMSEFSEELLPEDDGSSSSDSSMDTEREVLEGLEPHKDLKHLQISGYNGTTSPTWLSSNISVTSLQTLHLDDCGGWRILPLESLPFLTKLKLSRMSKVTEVSIPSLEELVLIRMPKLVRCSSTSVEGLSSSLRVLQIKKCRALTVFDLFKSKIGQRSWLPGLRKLSLDNCPRLEVLNPLPSSTTCSELEIYRVSTLPNMMGSCSEKLMIGDIYGEYDVYSEELKVLNKEKLAFHNLGGLKMMDINACQNLSSFSFQGFSQLVSLESLDLWRCKTLFCSNEIADATHEVLTAANCRPFPSLKRLTIDSCGITGKWVSLLLRHAPVLEELHLKDILSIEGGESSQSNYISFSKDSSEEEGDSSSGEQDDTLTGQAQDGLVQIPLNLISSLKKITIRNCPRQKFNWGSEGLSGLTSLQELHIWDCLELFWPVVHNDRNYWVNGRCLLPTSLEEFKIRCSYSQKTLQPCYASDLTNLKKLEVFGFEGLESLHLHSCTALEELTIEHCGSLTALEGLQYLSSLRHLKVYGCPRLVYRDGNDEHENGRWLLPKSLWELDINDCSEETLRPCFPRNVTRLKKLQLLRSPGLKSLQLHSCTAMENLMIESCTSLMALEGLQSLSSLRHLDIFYCPALRFYDLCSRLETLKTNDLSVFTTSSCNHLTSLRCLELRNSVLTEEEGRALILIKSLQELVLIHCHNLVDLPVGLHTLPSLKRLEISSCDSISRLPETGLPLSLEELEIRFCTKKLADQCRMLATIKLNVKISWCD